METTTTLTIPGCGTVNITDRTMNAIRSCRSCSHVRTFIYHVTTGKNLVRRLADGTGADYNADLRFGGALTPAALRCPACGGLEKVALVAKVRVTKHECNGKCMASKSGVCECSCGGKNHGMAYSAA